jgi:UDP-N-acetyl-D-mannosaminuronate dehydrogenase
MIKIGIVGGGFVGQATFLLNCKDIHCIIYDIDPSKCFPQSTTFNDLKDCHIVFICVPTPMNSDRTCYTKIVEDVRTRFGVSLETEPVIV